MSMLPSASTNLTRPIWGRYGHILADAWDEGAKGQRPIALRTVLTLMTRRCGWSRTGWKS